MKMWIGNYDGTRQGLIIASSKERARKIINASRTEFDGYWVQQPTVDTTLDVETLYTRKIDRTPGKCAAWVKGRCTT